MSKSTQPFSTGTRKVAYVIPKTFADDIVRTPVPLTRLIEILTLKRCAGSVGEEKCVALLKQWLEPHGVLQDEYGNLHVRIPRADGKPATTCFSCHTDTVEKQKATDTKLVAFNHHPNGMMMTTKGGGVLGADDGAGIFMLLNLIEAGVPGLYLFHREEECGGGGSRHIAEKTPWVLEGIERAIAFDRRGCEDIINFQGSIRCASDDFAQALADAFNELIPGAKMKPDDGGTFTDTKNYVHLVPECTNVAVGYYHQHTQEECQDLSFLTRLAAAAVMLDWENLPTARDPLAEEEDEEGEDFWTSFYRGTSGRFGSNDYPSKTQSADSALTADLLDVIQDYPLGATLLLKSLGYDDVYELEEILFRLEQRYDVADADDDKDLY